MQPNLRLAAAAAVVLLIAGIGLAVVSRAPAVGVQPSPTPTAVPTASTRTVTDLGPLESRWISKTPRHWPGPVSATSPFVFTIGPREMVINNFRGDVLSTVALAGTDSVKLTLQNVVTYWDCHAGDAGTYTITLSSAGDTLTLTPVTEPCPTRSSVLSGAWARSSCPGDALCLGDLQPGSHVTNFFHAYLAAPDQVAYAVPEGWSNTTDDTTYVLAKRNAPPTTSIVLYPGVFPQSQTNGCVDATSTAVDRSAKALADWLTTLPGLVTTQPTPVKIGALTGFVVDVSIAPGWTQTCANGQGKPVVNTFTSGSEPGGPFHAGTAPYRVSLVGAARDRYVVIDLSDGNTLLIDMTAPDKATWDALLPEAMPIVESFRFTH
ncbi:MAG: hypothetical protein QOE66_448 [Chloroflexota bacterium]|jgi:hypothetical protein|nr:hypothetical protein [Chloroflexota bacterium]